MLDDHAIHLFQEQVWDYYRRHGRHDLPWRQPSGSDLNAYHVAVSELMLQQTQVSRVLPKYHQFLANFPTVTALANAPLGEVLRAWSGLGYNRRAKFLWQAAGQVVRDHGSEFPRQLDQLTALPGIGPNTAGAILAYAYNEPAIFVETNIRTVYIHHFFHDQTDIADKAVLELVAETLDPTNPREWYWALMDYGAHLKRTVGNLNHRSRTYARQSAFHGSRRQLRGQVLRLLGAGKPRTLAALQTHLPDDRLPSVLDDLVSEQLIQKRGQTYRL
ncbi:MAG TPA: hypothetical protein VHA37_08305 [Candidatus Saccharimonadales bacterium]|nr:hypothetical protein [Candidatus Saccharimonadales bacterium]